MPQRKLRIVTPLYEATFDTRGAVATSWIIKKNKNTGRDLFAASSTKNNPQPLDVRQKIANISVFVLSQTAALQMSPQFDHFRPLIEINRNIAAGLSGRP